MTEYRLRWAALLVRVALAVLVAAVTLVDAQSLDRGDVAGTIRDQTGAALAGVTVTLRESTTGVERVRVTDDAGRFSAPLLSPGVYVVQAERSGFAGASSEPLRLGVGQALAVNLVMSIAGLTETLAITAAGDAAPALGAAFDTSAISSLPLNGHDYRGFALLSPTAEAITGTRGTFRVAGQPGDYLALNVDGADFFGESGHRAVRQHIELAAFGAGQTVELVDIAVGCPNGGTFGHKSLGNRAADALTRGCDDSHFTL